MTEQQQLIEIVYQLHSGNKDAAAMLYEVYYRDLHYYILKRVNDPEKAEALTQDVFIEIFDRISTLDKKESFVEWSQEIADRRCGAYKKMRRELLIGKLGTTVVDSVVEEKSSDDDVVVVPVTRLRAVFKSIEPFLKKLIVGIVTTVILAAIKDVGVDWKHKETDVTLEEIGSFEEGERIEETDNSEETEALTTQENDVGDNDDEITTAADETEGETEGESATKDESVAGTEPATEKETEKATEKSTESKAEKPTMDETEPIETEPIETEPTIDELAISEGLEFTHVGSYYEVSGIGTCSDSVIVIPEEYNGLPVGSIGAHAFQDCSVTRIILPDSILLIESNAFRGCTQLAELNIPDSVVSISDGTFIDCRSLTEIELPKRQKVIGAQMFAGCHNLKSVVIPDGVETIEWEAFAYCYSLTSIKIPASVTSIDRNAFYWCDSLTEIVVEESNPVYCSVDNCVITKASKTLRIGCNGSVIPADGSVTQIGDYAFIACRGWKSVIIPEGITSIGKSAFETIPLKSVSIPKSVISIGDNAFFNGCALESILYAGTEEQWDCIEKGAGWDEYAGNYKLYCLGEENGVVEMIPSETEIAKEVPIESEVTETLEFRRMGSYYEVFGIENCTETDIIIPAEYNGYPVTIIGESAFQNSSITSITLPESIQKIGRFAFSGCNDLEIVCIPDSVTEIEDNAFNNCFGLAEIILPKNLKRIGNYAFIGCKSLKRINFPENLCYIGVSAFSLSGLTSISISAEVTTIGRNAFYGSAALEYVSVDEGNAMYYSVNNCLISKTTRTLLQGCRNSRIPTDGSIVKIDNGAFAYCENFYEISIPEGIISIEDAAFESCSLKSVTIPVGVVEIGVNAFGGNYDLETIYYGGTKEQWNMIEKRTEWDRSTGSYTVYCSDGEIKK